MTDLPTRLHDLLSAARAAAGRIVVLTGAGVSAESGVPTFRGPEGYWRIGSRHYRPEQLATFAAFSAMPREIWGWYLHRRGVCSAAAPNAAHRALVALEQALGDRFLLVTQNVDGLHARAGSSAARTCEVHGNLGFARCAAGCAGPEPLPAGLGAGWPKDRLPDEPQVLERLHCRRCGGWLRPHVLWFDECYDEPHYRADSAFGAVDDAALVLVAGTSGATSLPDRMVRRAAARRIPLVVVNLEPSPFSELAECSASGCFVQGTAGDWLPRAAAALQGDAR